MLKVQDLMTRSPTVIGPEASLREVLDLMHDQKCRHVPVLDAEGCLVGIITDRDVRLALNSPLVLHERWQDDLLMDKVTVEGCMTREVVVVTPETPASEGAAILSARKFDALPVVERSKLVGIITVTDYLVRFAEDHREI